MLVMIYYLNFFYILALNSDWKKTVRKLQLDSYKFKVFWPTFLIVGIR